METDFKEYKNLTGLLLGPIRQRPAMYLGEAKISLLSNFIFGYSMGFHMAKSSDNEIDDYFGEAGFLEWFFQKYNLEQTSFWETPFLNEANNDEKKALQLFFEYLEKYDQEKETKWTAVTNIIVRRRVSSGSIYKLKEFSGRTRRQFNGII